MTALAAALVTLAGLLGVALTLATLPGTWVAIAAALSLWWWRPDLYDSWWPVGVSIGLALLAEIIEVFASAAGAARKGGGRAGAIGSVLGALAGAIVGSVLLWFLPIIGTVLGAVAGAGLGAFMGERGVTGRSFRDSASIASGAAVGRLMAVVIKGVFALAIALTLAVAAWL